MGEKNFKKTQFTKFLYMEMNKSLSFKLSNKPMIFSTYFSTSSSWSFLPLVIVFLMTLSANFARYSAKLKSYIKEIWFSLLFYIKIIPLILNSKSELKLLYRQWWNYSCFGRISQWNSNIHRWNRSLIEWIWDPFMKTAWKI